MLVSNNNNKMTLTKRPNNPTSRLTGQCLRTLQHCLVLHQHYFYQLCSISVGHPSCDIIRTIFSTVGSYSTANHLVKLSHSPVSLQWYGISACGLTITIGRLCNHIIGILFCHWMHRYSVWD